MLSTPSKFYYIFNSVSMRMKELGPVYEEGFLEYVNKM